MIAWSKSKLISLCFGKVHRKAVPHCHVSPLQKNTSPKTPKWDQMRVTGWWGRSVCECVWLCVSVKGSKKEEVRHSEYIPTGMRLRDNPVWLSALQQSEGCGYSGGALKERGQIATFATTSSLSYQPVLICKQKAWSKNSLKN